MNVASFETTDPASLTAIEPEAPSITVDEETESYARLIAEPLAAGFGITLGNSMRRALLGSLP